MGILQRIRRSQENIRPKDEPIKRSFGITALLEHDKLVWQRLDGDTVYREVEVQVMTEAGADIRMAVIYWTRSTGEIKATRVCSWGGWLQMDVEVNGRDLVLTDKVSGLPTTLKKFL